MEKRLCLLSDRKVGYPHPKPGTFTGRPARTIGVGQPYNSGQWESCIESRTGLWNSIRVFYTGAMESQKVCKTGVENLASFWPRTHDISIGVPWHSYRYPQHRPLLMLLVRHSHAAEAEEGVLL